MVVGDNSKERTGDSKQPVLGGWAARHNDKMFNSEENIESDGNER